MRIPALRRNLSVGLLASAVLLTGCTDGGDDDGGTSSAAEAGSSTRSGGGGTQESGSDARVEDVNLGSPIVEQTVALPERPEDEVTLGVLDLTVRGKVMVLRMAVTPKFSSESSSESISLNDALGEGYFTPTLLDEENLKEYHLIEQFGPTGWKSDENTSAVNGTPILAWAYFAAPEDDIDAVDLRVRDGFPAFLDVPITP